MRLVLLLIKEEARFGEKKVEKSWPTTGVGGGGLVKLDASRMQKYVR